MQSHHLICVFLFVVTYVFFEICRYKHNERQGLVSAVDEIQKEATETPFEEQKKLVQVRPKNCLRTVSKTLVSNLKRLGRGPLRSDAWCKTASRAVLHDSTVTSRLGS
jgi:hypothetical protein